VYIFSLSLSLVGLLETSILPCSVLCCKRVHPKEKAKSDQLLKFAAFYLGCLLLFTFLPSPPLESAVESNVLCFPLFIHNSPEMCIFHFLLYRFLHNHLLFFFSVPLSRLSSSRNWAKLK